MIVTVVLMACLVLHNSFAQNPNYRVCTDDECYNDDNPKDPRTEALNLYDSIQIADAIAMPDFELYALFHNGELSVDPNGDHYTECVCPLTKKCDEMYAVFHDDQTLSVNYNWTLPWSPYSNYNMTGSLEIAAKVFYNVYFINETNGVGPSIDRINITNYHIFSWWIDGQPLEMLEKIPDELFKKTIIVVMKQTVEDKMTTMYNNAIKGMKGNFLRTSNRRHGTRGHTTTITDSRPADNRRRTSIRLLNLLKSQKKISTKRSKYFYKH